MKLGLKHLFNLAIVIPMAVACAKPKSTSQTTMNNTLHCHLEIAQTIPLGEQVILTLIVNNASQHSIEFLQYHTPFEGLLGNIFDLTFNTEMLTYSGRMVKRLPPGDQDWLAIEAGKFLSASVDISKAWDLSQTGEYQLSLNKSILYRDNSNSNSVSLPTSTCGKVKFSIF